MRIFSTFFVALATLAPSHLMGAPAFPTTSIAILARIDHEGGRAVYQELIGDETSFDRVTAQIESGGKSWLRVAAALRPFADAAGAESLDFAVARALPMHPVRVLIFMRNGYGLVCTSPYIEPPAGVSEAYEKKALAALASIRDPSLKPVALQCAKGIRLP